MPADRRLRRLQDRAELGDGELVAFQREENAATRDVAEDREVVENRGGGGGDHPSIRID